MKNYLLIFSLLVIGSSAIAQNGCYLSFNSQAEIDAFDISECNEFIAGVSISGIDITNLEGLSSLTTCQSISIRNTSIVNFNGLQNLTTAFRSWTEGNNNYAGGSVTVEDNALLENFQGLNNLRTTSTLNIRNNAVLITTSGLNITNFPIGIDLLNDQSGQAMYVIDNPMLEAIVGTNGLRDAGKISIIDNPSLTNISGLSNVRSFCHIGGNGWYNGRFSIINNDALTNLNGLNNIQVCGTLEIKDNNSLQSIAGLNGLEIGLRFDLHNNNALIDLGDISMNLWYLGKFSIQDNMNLNSIDLDLEFEVNPDFPSLFVEILNNENLEICNSDYICELISEYPENIGIDNNGSGCSSLLDVIEDCGINYFAGNIYLDEDCSGLQDSSEYGVSEIVLNDSIEDLPITNTDQNGDFFFLEYIIDGLELQPETVLGYSYSPSSYFIQNSLETIDTLDFGLCPDSLFSNLAIDHTGLNPPRPGFTNEYQVCVTNNGSVIEEGTLSLTFSQDLNNFLTFIHTDGASINGLELSWGIEDMDIFSTICHDIVVGLTPDTPLDIEVVSLSEVASNLSFTELMPDDNKSDLVQIVVGSYDPNDKLVSPDMLHFDDLDSLDAFEYQIRFQNTGTANAEKVVIIDTIPQELDVNSFKMISSSHPYRFEIAEEGIITWTFDNIDLPPLQEDSLGSNGFVKFNMAKSQNFSEVIKNRAAIYFDFNNPIITEYAEVSFISSASDFDVSMDVIDTTQCHLVKYKIDVNNRTENFESTQFKLFMPDAIVAENIEYLNFGDAVLMEDTLIWDTGIISGGDNQRFYFEIRLNEISSDFDTLNFTVRLDDDLDLSNNTILYKSKTPHTAQDLILETQEDVDNCYCYHSVRGDLKTSINAIFSSIENLGNIKDIRGDLEIYSVNGLQSINGFDNLERIGGNLTIRWNTDLEHLSGFERLGTIAGILDVENNDLDSISGFNNLIASRAIYIDEDLSSLSGFDNLKIIHQYLFLEYVENISAFENLESIGTNLIIEHCSDLEEIAAFNNLKFIGNDLIIRDNRDLISISAFNNLEEIVGDFIISINPYLTTIGHINKLKSVNHLAISSNSRLSSLEHFTPPLNDVEEVALSYNPLLTKCHTDLFCGLLEDPDIVFDISNNGTGCASEMEIANQCLTAYDDPDFSISMEILQNTCDRVECIINVENKRAYTTSTNLKFKIDDENISDLYDIIENDEAGFIGDTLFWEVDSLVGLGTQHYKVVLQLDREFSVLDTLQLSGHLKNDNSELNNQVSELVSLPTESGWRELRTQEDVDNCYCYEKVNDNLVFQWSEEDILNFDGLNSLREIEGDLLFYNMDHLKRIEGFNNLEKVGGGFLVSGNDSLSTITGFNNLTSIDFRLSVYWNPELVSINKLEDLEFLHSIYINDNDKLNSIDFLPPSTTGVGVVDIVDNPSLNICNTELICNLLENASVSTTIENNADGCNSISEVQESCTSSTDDYFSEVAFKIYPNPASNQVYIESTRSSSTTYNLKLASIDGSYAINKQEVDLNNFNLDVEHLPQGIYILTIESEEGNYVERIVVGN